MNSLILRKLTSVAHCVFSEHADGSCSLLTHAECTFASCQWEEWLWQGDWLQRKEFKSNLLSPARQACPDDKGPNGKLCHTVSALSSFSIYLFLFFKRFIQARSQRCSGTSWAWSKPCGKTQLYCTFLHVLIPFYKHIKPIVLTFPPVCYQALKSLLQFWQKTSIIPLLIW